jgi:hypothetical protein
MRISIYAVLVAVCIAQAAAAQPADYAALIQQARERFSPPGEQQLAAARRDLTARIQVLERFVRPQSANGQKWLSYLKWADMKRALAAQGEVDLAPLAATHRQLNRNEVGLELPQFRGVSDALRTFIELSNIARTPEPAAVYNALLDGLASDVARLQTQPAPLVDYDVGRRLDSIAGVGQAPELIAAVRQEFARPNAFLNVSTDLLRAAAEEPIDRTDPVTDTILGTSIRGTGHTTGTVNLNSLPSDEAAAIELLTAGHVVSQNTGRNGPAIIRTTGYTDFTAKKRVDLTDAAFRAVPATVEAKSRSDIHSVTPSGGGFAARQVYSQGMSRARANQPRANAIAADHAEVRIAKRIDQEVAGKLTDARRRYEDAYRNPLARHGELPKDLHFRSTDAALVLEVTQAGRTQLGAYTSPPELPAGHDMVVRLGESALNNYWAVLLGGATASETEPGQEGPKFDVTLPKWMKDAWQRRKTDTPAADLPAEEFEPWTMMFRRGRPLTTVFGNGRISLTVHVARITSGEDEFTEWDVTGTFIPQIANGGLLLRREGDLVVLPTGFDTARGQLTPREVGLRTNLAKVFNERSAQGRGFPSQIEFPPLEPAGALAKVGPLALSEFRCAEGWITLAWDREKAE